MEYEGTCLVRGLFRGGVSAGRSEAPGFDIAWEMNAQHQPAAARRPASTSPGK
jgi:hypothetical protein